MKYNKKITLSRKKADVWQLDSDKGSHFDMFAVTAKDHALWTPWWNMQHRSSLREWQKEILRLIANSVLPDLVPYIVFRPGNGQSQPHTVAIAHSNESNIWVLITDEDFWITQSNYGHIEFVRGVNSLGCVVNENNRQQKIYPMLDIIKNKLKKINDVDS